MKTLFSTGAIAAFLGLAVVSTYAQTQTTTSSTTTYIETSKLVGKPVKSSQGEEIGTIKDVVIDRSTGCMAYTVLSTGGGGGRGAGGGKMVAVPWTVYSPSSDVNTYTVTVDRERIYNAPVFDYARIEEYSRPDYITNVYSYYGVSPAAGVGVGVSTGTTTTGTSTTTGTTTGATTTGANTTAGAASSPAAGAPAAGSPASTATDGRRAHPGAAAAAGAAAVKARETATPSPYGRPGTSPSKERTPSAKQKQQQTPSSRSDTERSETGTRSETAPKTERAPSEGAGTGEKTKGSTRERSRSREATSPPERPQE